MTTPDDVLKGLYDETLVGNAPEVRDLVNKGLEESLGRRLNVSPESHYMGALGAALFALDHVLAGAAEARPAVDGAGTKATEATTS